MSSPSKLTIKAFEKDDCSGSPVATYEAQVNPSSYSVNRTVSYNTTGPIGNAGTVAKYKGMEPRTMTFELLFDGTGVIESKSGAPFNVAAELQTFENVTCAYDGTIHRPRYLLILWGSVTPFPCVLTSLSTTYKLFDIEGNPIRALANVTFTSAEPATKTAIQADNQSPDLTHIVTVRAGDTLPQLSTQIYGNPSYYLELARCNSIVNFRSLRPGQQIKLPPLN
jgi:Contractile injection system tube protein/LysM domain